MESLTSFLTWTAYGDEKTIQEGHQAKADKENSDLDDKKNEETSREGGEPCKEEEKVQGEQEVTVQHNGDQNDEQNEQMGLEVL